MTADTKAKFNWDPRKPTSSFTEDDVEGTKTFTINPSTELIADEYENNGLGSVYIFRDQWKSDSDNTAALLDAFEECGYQVPSENIIVIDVKKSVELELKRISELDHSQKSCLIVIFLGNIDANDNFIPFKDGKNRIPLTDIWRPFVNCPTLKFKPKIFLLQAFKEKPEVQHDAHRIFTDSQEYDIPSEADMLIVFKKIEGTGDISAKFKFITELCKNFDTHGRRDDIIGLVTHTDHSNEKRPLIISTLTRKFYVTSSEYRDHFLDIENQQNVVMDTITELQRKIDALENSTESKRRKVKATSSFRKIVNTFTNRIGNSSSKPEDVAETDSGEDKSKRTSAQEDATLTVTDSAAGKKRVSRKLDSPRPSARKASNVDAPKVWRP